MFSPIINRDFQTKLRSFYQKCQPYLLLTSASSSFCRKSENIAQIKNSVTTRLKFRPIISFTTKSKSNPISQGIINQEAQKRPEKLSDLAVYDSKIIEQNFYAYWEANHFFSSKGKNEIFLNDKTTGDDDRELFVMCLPPPNVTGDLHLGHALTIAIQDCIARWQRMIGKKVVWIPGFDHAGIATQLVVEKQLWREKGLTKHDLSRQEFLEICEKWKNKKMEFIVSQMKRMGASLNWERIYYTRDKKFSHAVFEAFKRLYSDGLIFRDNRLINWSPYLQSTISDQEIDNVSIDSPQKIDIPGIDQPVDVGWLYYVDYSLIDCGKLTKVTVATTRPETILADEALAVNPRDQRYASLIGRKVRHPLISEKSLPIIADDTVEMDLGTGVLKVTPAHDMSDYQIGKRHSLNLATSCLDERGVVTPEYRQYAGLNRFEARRKILENLESEGRLAERKPHKTILPLCGRTGDVIEPRLKEQWFMKCQDLAGQVLNVVERKEIKIEPELFEQIWKQWTEKTEDWCISRQILWGHQIPTYFYENKWVVSENLEQAEMFFGCSDSRGRVSQDSDVLDTWFSSALVPLVTMGWPENSRPQKLSLMETGHDILGFWVTRMVMMSLKLANQTPFDRVLFHGLVKDAQGRKMSKSLGNVVDPLDVIEGKTLPELQNRLKRGSLAPKELETATEGMRQLFPQGIPCAGADALRFTLLRQNVKDVELNFDVDHVGNSRNFCNKLWQGFNFCKIFWAHAKWTPGVEGEGCRLPNKDELQRMDSVNQWVLSRLSHVIKSTKQGLDKAEFHYATQGIYEFWVKEVCDIYLEYLKPLLNQPYDQPAVITASKNLSVILDQVCRLLAPFMPYLTEELMYQLRNFGNDVVYEWDGSVHQMTFPNSKETSFMTDRTVEEAMLHSMRLIHASRSFRAQFGIPAKTELNGVVLCPEKTICSLHRCNTAIRRLAKLEIDNLDQSITDSDMKSIMENSLPCFIDERLELFVNLKGINREEVGKRLSYQLESKKRRRENLLRKTEIWKERKGNERQKEKWEKRSAINENSVRCLDSDINKLESMLNRMRE